MQGNGHARVSLHEKIADLAHWDEIECELAVRGVAREYDISVRELRKAIAGQRTRNDRRATPRGRGLCYLENEVRRERRIRRWRTSSRRSRRRSARSPCPSCHLPGFACGHAANPASSSSDGAA
jgi:hypothetical protein